MKKLNFVATNQNELNFSEAVKKNVYEYFSTHKISTKGNSFLIFQTVFMLVLYLGPWFLLLCVDLSLGAGLFMFFLMGVGMAGIGMCVMHDAAHGAYSQSRNVNVFLSGVLYLLGGNVLNWKIQHNILHHTFTNIEGYDKDIDPHVFLRLSEFSVCKTYHQYQHIYAFFLYGFLTFIKLILDFFQMHQYVKSGLTGDGSKNINGEFIKMLAAKLIYLFCFLYLPMRFTAFTFLEILLGFFIIHWVSGCILSIVFQMAHVCEGALQVRPNQEGDVVPSNWAVHQLRTSSDFAHNNFLLNWYVGGLNYQIEHHLFPEICHVHYKKIAPIVRRTAQEFGLSYNYKPSFKSAIFSHIKRLKILGQKI